MTTWIVTEKATGTEVYRYSADAPIEWSGMEFATHDHAAVLSDIIDVIPRMYDQRITKLAFRNRFTQTEKVAIEIAQLDDPTKTMPQRAMSAALRASQADVQAATFIDLSRADTRSGVQALEMAGLLATGRAAVILDTEPTAEETYK